VAARSDNPYVGPRPFRRGERLRGRDREALGLADKLLGERIVLLHSPSGAGKTSLIQAMLVPAMEERGFQICARTVPSFSALRVNNPPPSTFPVRNRYVFSAVLGLLDGAAESASALADVTLAEALDRMRERPQVEPYQFVIFDQLEEVLTLNPADWDLQTAFFRQLGEALEDDRRWALLSMREDYMGGLDRFTPQLPTGLRSRYRLDFLQKDAALEAIQGPARERGVDFTDEAAAALVDDLRKVRVQGPGQEPTEISGPYVEPVHLQVVCHRLWRTLRDRMGADLRSITAEQIQPFRDVAGALGAYYADAVRETARRTGTAERLIRDWFENQLITADHFRSQTVVGPAVDEAGSAAVLERLERRYLVRADMRAGTVWYELSHDRLVEPVLSDNAAWRRTHLADWQNRAEEWRRSGKDRSLLLTGDALRVARHAMSGRQANDAADERTEREFVELSAKANAEQRSRLRASRTVLALATVILVETVVILVLLVAG
jgi:hypothetical protein